MMMTYLLFQNFANGNGNQQFMVVDQETGVAELMPDPTQAAPVDNTSGVTVLGEGGNDNLVLMKGEDNSGNIMVMLPNGEQGMVVAGEDLQNHGLGELVPGGVKEQMYVVTNSGDNSGVSEQNEAETNRNSVSKVEPNQCEQQQLFNGFNTPTNVESQTTLKPKPTSVHNINVSSDSSMIRVVGIPDKTTRPQISVVKVRIFYCLQRSF